MRLRLSAGVLAIWEVHPGHPGTAGIADELLLAAGRPEEAAAILARAEAQ